MGDSEKGDGGGKLRGRRARQEAEAIELALARGRMIDRAHDWLAKAGLGQGRQRFGSRQEHADHVALAFERARDESAGDFFACLGRMPGTLSSWFLDEPWMALGALKAGFDPLAAGHEPRWNFERVCSTCPERRELIERGLALGWNPDEGELGGRRGASSTHPVAECVWLWMCGHQSEEDSLGVIEAMLRAGSSFSHARALEAIERAPGSLASRAIASERATRVFAQIACEREAAALEIEVGPALARASGSGAKSL